MKISIKREGFDGEVVLNAGIRFDNRFVGVQLNGRDHGRYSLGAVDGKLHGYHFRAFRLGLGLTTAECDTIHDGMRAEAPPGAHPSQATFYLTVPAVIPV